MTLEEIKEQLVVAHQNGNWELAQILSQQKEKLKKEEKKKHKCHDCEVTTRGTRCQMHEKIHRHYRNKLYGPLGAGFRDKQRTAYRRSVAISKLNKEKGRISIQIQDEIIALIARSFTREDIATMRNLSGKTIAYHMVRAGKRLKIAACDVAGFTRYALTKGLITLPLILILVACKSSTTPAPVVTNPPLPTPLVRPVKPVPMVSSNTTSNIAKLVAPIPTNTVTLAWDAGTPTSNSVPTDGYRLYQGSISKTYTNTYDVGNALLGIVNAAKGTNYFNVKAYFKYGPSNELDSPFTAELVYFATPNQSLLYIDTFVQTNSTLNTNLWGNVQKFPSVIITNPPSPIYGRTLIQMSYH